MFVNFGSVLSSVRAGASAAASLSAALPVSTGAINVLSHNIGDIALSERMNVIIQGASSKFIWGNHIWGNHKTLVAP